MNFSKIRMMFFDFDDTLLIHYREQKLDATADAHRARLRGMRLRTGAGTRYSMRLEKPIRLSSISSKAATVSRNTALLACRTV